MRQLLILNLDSSFQDALLLGRVVVLVPYLSSLKIKKGKYSPL
jgi:hypothetical protein